MAQKVDWFSSWDQTEYWKHHIASVKKQKFYVIVLKLIHEEADQYSEESHDLQKEIC